MRGDVRREGEINGERESGQIRCGGDGMELVPVYETRRAGVEWELMRGDVRREGEIHGGRESRVRLGVAGMKWKLVRSFS
jgi:hypothetical protein